MQQATEVSPGWHSAAALPAANNPTNIAKPTGVECVLFT